MSDETAKEWIGGWDATTVQRAYLTSTKGTVPDGNIIKHAVPVLSSFVATKVKRLWVLEFTGEGARFAHFAVAIVGERVPGLDHHVVNPFSLDKITIFAVLCPSI